MKQSKVEETKVEKTESGQDGTDRRRERNFRSKDQNYCRGSIRTEGCRENRKGRRSKEIRECKAIRESGYRYTGTGENGKGNQSGNGACEGKKETQE